MERHDLPPHGIIESDGMLRYALGILGGYMTYGDVLPTSPVFVDVISTCTVMI